MTENVTVTKVINQVQIASDGPQGPQGPQGPTGATGATGPSGVVSVTAPITNSGTSTSAVIGINAGVANGVATLDSGGKIPQSQIPAVAITNTFVVASQAAMLALTAEEGDVAIRTDVSKSFILTAVPASTLGNWQELLTPPDAVSSVDGRVGTVTLTDKYAQLATANTFTQAQTATSLIVTGSTVPTNGMYLPAANTLGFATNSAVRMQINSAGEFGIGTTSATGITLQIGKNITGTTASYVANNVGFIQSDVTSSATYYRTFARTANANFGITAILHYDASSAGTFDNVTAGGSVIAQYGYRVTNTLTGATSNYGFYGDLAAATGRWNTYMNGTAANYFAGQTTVGSTSLTLGSGSVAQQFGVVAGAATTVGLVVKGAASATANFTEWQDSAGTVQSRVTSTGSIRSNQAMVAGNASGSAVGVLNGYTQSTTQVGLNITGLASQTGDLTLWRNSSGTTLARVDAVGNIVTGNMAIATSSVATIHISNGTIPSANPTGGGVLYVEAGALKYRGSSGTITTIANA